MLRVHEMADNQHIGIGQEEEETFNKEDRQ